MYLDYSKLAFDADGRPEYPELILQTMGGKTIGTIPGVSNLKMRIKYSEPSEIEFDVSSVLDGGLNWIYGELSGYKLVYTESYGVYILMNPTESADGIERVKHIKGFSLEYTLNSKKIFLEEGTFKFFDATNAYNADTLIGRVLEVAVGWGIGTVSENVAGKYLTFDQYDSYLLPFLYGDAATKYHCVFVFDPYAKTISVYDADEPLSMLPIYMDYANLIETTEVNEISDELFTALRPYGSDELSIRPVNPIGTDWIYDLSWFISNGDIPEELAAKWNAWQRSILNRQSYYTGLISLRASGFAQLAADQAKLTDLQGELETLKSQRSVTIQALAMEITASGRQTQQARLDELNAQIAAKEAAISAQEAAIDELIDAVSSEEEGSYAARIAAVVEELAIENYFTADELLILSQFMIEQDLTEDSFVASSVDTTVSGTSYALDAQPIIISNASIERVSMDDYGKNVYVISGGGFSLAGLYNIAGDVIRGTVETGSDGSFVASFYAGSIQSGMQSAKSGMLTLSGTYSGLTSDIHAVTADGLTLQLGSTLQFTVTSGSLFLSANVSDYQKYSVEMELYDFAVKVLADAAQPVYEFSVDAGNFLFAKDFAPFRDELELGKGVYLRLDEDEVITPYIIEFELDFENASSFSLLFSNRFQRKDAVNTLKDMLDKSYSYGRSFNASKYIYGQTVAQASAVSRFINGSFDSAVNTIIAAKDQSVIIDGSGIDITSSDKSDPYLQQFGLHLTNGMIAFTQDGWQHAEIAIGVFKTESGYHSGVNARVISGNMLIGNELVIENMNDDGVMQFMVDASGAWLYNSTFTLAKDNGGKIMIDPRYGIVGGTGNLYTLDGTTVIPSFINAAGEIEYDAADMPKNANFYLDLDDGSAYFRGKILAQSGMIGGFTIAEDYLHAGQGSGNFVAMNGSGSNAYAPYAFWTGATNPENAPFWVKKDGSMRASNGEFSGTITAARVVDLSAVDDDEYGWIVGCGIAVPSKERPKFLVDKNGNVTLSGHITWNTEDTPVQYQYSVDGANFWHEVMTDADMYRKDSLDGGQTWSLPYQFRASDGSDAEVTYENVNAALGDFFSRTFGMTYIDNKLISAPTISGGKVYGSQLMGAQIYAGDGGSVMAQITANTSGDESTGGFYLMKDTGTTDSSGNKVYGAKAALYTTEGPNDSMVALTLGIGASSYDGLKGRFVLSKVYQNNQQGGVIMYATSGGKISAVTFEDDGSISITGMNSASDPTLRRPAINIDGLITTSGTFKANAGINTTAIQLRAGDGNAAVQIFNDANQLIGRIGVNSSGNLQIDPGAEGTVGTLWVNGNLKVAGEIIT